MERKLICDICKSNYFAFIVPKKEWKKVPMKYSYKYLCRNCFKKVTGIKNPYYFSYKERCNIRRMLYQFKRN